MKKYKTFAYILVVFFIIIAIAFISYQVKSSNPTKETEMKQKAKTEIKYIESKMLTLFNQMNNIQFENYKISISEISPSTSGESSEKSTEKSSKSGEGGMNEETSSGSNKGEGSNSSGSESSSAGEGNSEGQSSESGSNGKSSSGGSSSSQSSKGEEKSTTTYNLEPTGVLLNNEDIDWNKIKSEVENIYISIPTITLDLYKTDVEDQDILNFNTEFDILTREIENQKKAETLAQLVKVYENVVKFIEKTGEEQDKIVAKTKLNIYRAYSKLDSENWEEIAKDIKSSVEEFTKLLTGAEIKDEKQYSINKIYIMLSELQKAIDQKNTQIFLIKYKNTLEELSNI